MVGPQLLGHRPLQLHPGRHPVDRVQPVVSALPHWAQRVVSALRPLQALPEPLDSAEGLQPLDPEQEAVAAAWGSMEVAGRWGSAEVAVGRREPFREHLGPAEVEVARPFGRRSEEQSVAPQGVAAALWPPLSAAVWAEVWTAVWSAIEAEPAAETVLWAERAPAAATAVAVIVVWAPSESEAVAAAVAEWRSFEWASSFPSFSARSRGR